MTGKYVQFGRHKYRILNPKKGRPRIKIVQRGIQDISNIKGLNQLQEIEELDLSNNKIIDITGLENLSNLKKLILKGNQIEEIKGLENFRTLMTLDLSGNLIKEIKGLENLNSLEELYLKENKIEDIKGLENLRFLRVLDLSYNEINDPQTFMKLKERFLNFTPHFNIELKGNPCFFPMMEVRAELMKQNPSKTRILSVFSDTLAQINSKNGKIYIFCEDIAEAIQLNPIFFLDNLYNDIRRIIEEHCGIEGRNLIERNILEKFFLFEGERILYEWNGDISLRMLPHLSVTPMRGGLKAYAVRSGYNYLTNYRIIAQGIFHDVFLNLKDFVGIGRELKRISNEPATIGNSDYQDLPINGYPLPFRSQMLLFDKEFPCYGFQIPIYNRIYLGKKIGNLIYVTRTEDGASKIEIILLKYPNKALDRDEILKNLKMEKEEVIDLALFSIKEILETVDESNSNNLSKKIRSIFKLLQKNEEYCHISDPDYLNIVGETYKLNPQFFVRSIFPFMEFFSIRKKTMKLFLNENFGAEL